MAGVGEASAIFAFAAAGLSFAKALTEYVQDWRAAPAEIRSLASEVEYLLGCVVDVENLLEQNIKTNYLTEAGVKRAHKNVGDCREAVETLRKLLQKGGKALDTANITKDDLDHEWLRRSAWPFYKSQLRALRTRLVEIQQQITITLISYQLRAG